MKINFIYDSNVSHAQMLGYEMSSLLWGKLFTDDIQVNIFAQGTDELDANVIGGAIPEFHEQHYALFLQYYEADITSTEDQAAFDMLQEGNTIDFLLNGDLVGGNTKLKLTTALAKALGMEEAISLERNLLEDNFLDGTIKMNQNFAWDFNYLRDAEGEENTLDFLSVTLHETGHILGFTSSLDFSLEQETLYSGREELSNFSPLDLFRFSAQSFTQENPDGAVADLSIGGTAWFSVDGGETISAKMSTGKDGDGFQASHWERRYDPLGVMDPTLWYQERVEISELDVLAFDVIGYDLSKQAENVEDLFTTEALAQILAQAKVQLAAKLGQSVEWIEENTDVPVTAPELWAEMGIDYTATQTIEIATEPEPEPEPENSLPESPSNEELDNSSEDELEDFFEDLETMMGGVYKWWAQSGGHNRNSSWQELYEWWAQRGGHNRNSSWQELYEWWAQRGGHNRNSSWQELYEWWAQRGGHNRNSSWQELYEWWAQRGGHNRNSSWQELYEWWVQRGGYNRHSSWQELSEEELQQFHQEVTGEKGVWWEDVFFNTQDGGDIQAIDLPGENHNLVIGPAEPAITGGNQDDIIGGDTNDNEIVAGVGDDLIDGAAGSDTVFGAAGNDTVFGDQGNDSIQGGSGDDVISGESGDDALLGEAGDDVLMGGENDDYLDGAEGRDFLNGQTGNDALIGGAGDDALEGEAGKDLIVGGAGEDVGNGGSGDDYIYGDEYSESLQQTFGNDLSDLTSIFNSTTTGTSGGGNTNSNDTNNNDNAFLAQDPFRVEAESLSWTGQHYTSNRSYASGGQLIRPRYTNREISGTTNFTGASGTYDIIIGYHDLEEANGRITVELNGTSIGSWNLTKNLGEELGSRNFTTHTISNVPLTTSNAINLKSLIHYSDEGGEGSLDYIEFVPVVEEQANNANSIVFDPDTNPESESTPTLNGVSYNFSEGIGDRTNDLNESNNDLILYNGVQWQSDSAAGHNSIVSFDGTDDYGTIDGLATGGAMTFSAWVNYDSFQKWSRIFDFGDAAANNNILLANQGNTNNLVLEIYDTNNIGGGKLTINDFWQVNTWTHVTATISETGLMRLYKNGELAGELQSTVIPTEKVRNNNYIGRSNWSSDGYFDGQLDDITISNSALDGNEVQSLYQNSLNKISIDGVSYNFTEGSGDRANNLNESNNDLILYNGVQWQSDLAAGHNSIVNFDGTDDYGTIDGLATGGAMTFSAWVNYDSFQKWSRIFDFGDAAANNNILLANQGNTNNLVLEIYDTNNIGGGKLTINDFWQVNTWTHVTATISETGLMRLYKNGELAGELQSTVIPTEKVRNNNYIGRSNWSSDGYFDGQLDDITISNSALDGNEVQSLYQNSLKTFSPSPLELPEDFNLGESSDILRGGAGNDGIDGGEGNDIIFGEDELDDSRNIYAPGIEGAVTRGHSSYILTSPDLTWEEAQAEAESYGGNLVTINDAAEGLWLRSSFGINQLWIGLTDLEQEGIWKWSSGETVTYYNWAPGEPNNANGNEHYAGMNFASSDRWNDVRNNYRLPGIIEIDWSSVDSNDTIFGGAGNDYVYGNSGNDLIYGEDNTENWSSVDSSDNLTGNGGHDTLNGGAGNDTLNGTDEIVAGYLERDILVGDDDADTFVLGDVTQAYYATAAEQDYAVIRDFNVSVDKLQLHGVVVDYQQQQQGNDVYLSHNGDLVAILENNNTLNLSSSAFEYLN